MMYADSMSKPIYSLVSQLSSRIKERATYHPSIAAAVDKPSCDLPGSLNNQQTTESLSQLEQRRRVSQHFVPSPDGHHFSKATGSKDPLLYARILGSLRVKRSCDPISAGVCIHCEAVHTPDQKAGYENPLCHPDHLYQRPSYS
jgi:hypothetical protein